MAVANNLDPDKDSVCLDLDPNRSKLVFLKNVFEKFNCEKKSTGNKSMKNYPACKELKTAVPIPKEGAN